MDHDVASGNPEPLGVRVDPLEHDTGEPRRGDEDSISLMRSAHLCIGHGGMSTAQNFLKVRDTPICAEVCVPDLSTTAAACRYVRPVSMDRTAELRLGRALRRLEGTAQHLRACLEAIDSRALGDIARDAVASAAGAAGDAALAAAYAGGSFDAKAVTELDDLVGEAGEALDILAFELQLGDGRPPRRVLECIRCVSGSLDDIRAVIDGPRPFADASVEWHVSACPPVGAYDPASPAETAAEAAVEPDDPQPPRP